MLHKPMQLVCVFRPAKVGVATMNFMNCHSHNAMNTNVHWKNALGTLSTLMNHVRGQGDIYVNMPTRYYSADAKQLDGKQKLLDCGFQHLHKELHLASAKTDITKIVKFVLEQKIKVSKKNVDHSDIKPYIHGNGQRKYRNKYGFKVGYFTSGDDKIIHDNWVQLLMLSGVKEPKALLEQPKDKKLSNDLTEIKLRNVVGMYLGQGLHPNRHCANVFGYASQILRCEKYRKFTPEEDKMILEAVKKNGDFPDTWKDLCSKLNRNVVGYTALRARYKNVLLSRSKKLGSWSFEEDKSLLEDLFRDCKICSVDAVKSVGSKDIKKVESIDRVQLHIFLHWDRVLKPILLSHHHNMLHSFDRPRILNYISETGVKYCQDINWDKLLKKFPSQTGGSLHFIVLNTYRNHRISKEDTLSDVLKKYIQNVPNQKAEYTLKEQEYREQIVSCYRNICSEKN